MPKKAKYSWYEPRQCDRKQLTMPDKSVRQIYAKTEREMDQKLAALQAEIEAGIESRKNPVFAQYVATWFPARTAELSEARKQDYRTAINNYIAPVIAWKKLREVTAQDGREIVQSMAGKSNSLQKKVVGILKNIFADAEEDGLTVPYPQGRRQEDQGEDSADR